MRPLFRLNGAVERHPAIALWRDERQNPLGVLAGRWFDAIRQRGEDVREVLHDGQPTACVGGAAFAYVAIFTAHVNVGFFHGAELPDPRGLLEGAGKSMRHVKLRTGAQVDEAALLRLIDSAYHDVKARLAIT